MLKLNEFGSEKLQLSVKLSASPEATRSEYALGFLVLAEGAAEHVDGVVPVTGLVVRRACARAAQPLAPSSSPAVRGARRGEHGRLQAVAPPGARIAHVA